MANNRFADLLVGYKREDESSPRLVTYDVSGKIISGSGSLYGAKFSRFTKTLSAFVSSTSTRAYGMFLLGFGLLTLLLHFAKDYMNIYTQVPLYVLIIGAAFSMLSIPLLLVDKPISFALQENSVTDYVLFEFFCIQRTGRFVRSKGMNSTLALVLGLLLACLGALVPLWYVVVGFFALWYAYVTFLSPEFSFLLIFMFIPYFPLLPWHPFLLAGAVLLTAISFFRKVTLGKRVFRIEQYDLIILLLMVFILVSGIFVKGIESFENSVVMFLLGFGYVFASSLVANRRIAECIINVLIVSGIPVSIISIVQFVPLAADGIFFDGVKATFDDSTELAMFMIVSVLMSVYFVKESSRKSSKFFYSVTLLLSLFSLFASGCTFAFVALVLGYFGYAVSRMRSLSWLPLLLLLFAPYLLLLLHEVLLPIFDLPVISFFGISEIARRWRVGIAMFKDNFLVGIGIGEDCFAEELGAYTDVNASFLDSGNFLLELGCEAGVFALVIFLALLICRLRHSAVYSSFIRHSHFFTLHSIVCAILVSLMCFGAVSYLWSDETMCYLFWCIFGIGSATLRAARQEHDERVDYYSDERTVHSSSIDIEVG